MSNEPRQPNGERYDYVSLCLATDAMLEEALRRGTRPDLEGLVGWEFRGYNTLEATSVVGIRKFKKGFYRDGTTGPGRIQGYNVKVRQNRLGDPWIDEIKGNDSFKHAWYDVYPVDLGEVDCKYPSALLLNYDSQRSFPVDPARLLRDYLVQLYPDNPDLLLGKAYAALGPLRLPLSFFVLERSNRSSLA